MSSRVRRTVIPIAALVLVVSGFFVLRGVLSRRVMWERTGLAPEEQPADTRPVTLYFGSPDGDGISSERREAPTAGGLSETVRSVMLQLISGPTAGLVPIFPPDTEIRDVYIGTDGVLYLNFTPSLVERHPGGSSAEFATLAALVRTMTENFAEVKAVQILVGGRPRETLAGHYGIRDPLRPEDFQP